MGILENWNEIERELDAWEKTIKHGRNVVFTCIIIGGILGASIIWLTESSIGLPVTAVFCGVGLYYQIVLGDRKIQAHIDRLDELKR